MNHASRYRTAMENFERQLLSDALDQHGWNRKRTAQFLGISYRSLIYYTERLNLISPNERARLERNAARFGITKPATSTGDSGPGPGSPSLNVRAS